MRFGTDVILRRGGHDTPAPGQYRDVLARYIGADGHRVYCELLEDDPDSIGRPDRRGERGWWERSIMRSLTESEKNHDEHHL